MHTSCFVHGFNQVCADSSQYNLDPSSFVALPERNCWQQKKDSLIYFTIWYEHMIYICMITETHSNEHIHFLSVSSPGH